MREVLGLGERPRARWCALLYVLVMSSAGCATGFGIDPAGFVAPSDSTSLATPDAAASADASTGGAGGSGGSGGVEDAGVAAGSGGTTGAAGAATPPSGTGGVGAGGSGGTGGSGSTTPPPSGNGMRSCTPSACKSTVPLATGCCKADGTCGNSLFGLPCG